MFNDTVIAKVIRPTLISVALLLYPDLGLALSECKTVTEFPRQGAFIGHLGLHSRAIRFSQSQATRKAPRASSIFICKYKYRCAGLDSAQRPLGPKPARIFNELITRDGLRAYYRIYRYQDRLQLFCMSTQSTAILFSQWPLLPYNSNQQCRPSVNYCYSMIVVYYIRV